MNNWKRDKIMEIVYLMNKYNIERSWILNKLTKFGAPPKLIQEKNIWDLLEMCPTDVISQIISELMKMEIQTSSPTYAYKMAEEKVQSELLQYGLTYHQSTLFVHLGKYGPMRASDASKSLKLSPSETYRLLSALQNKGIVFASSEPPHTFKAASFQEALKILSQSKK